MKSWLQRDVRSLPAYAALLGIAAGIASNHGFLTGSWSNLIFWAIIGIALGLFARDRRSIFLTGAIYGFFLMMTFLYSGYQGSAESIPGFIKLSSALSLIGVFCGIACVYVGSFLRSYIAR